MNIRAGLITDKTEILRLYKTVAEKEDGISRNPEEVTGEYVDELLANAIERGFIYVAEDPYNNDRLIAELHTYSYGVKALQHTLGHLTIIVHPDYQGTGIGRKIFSKLLHDVSDKRQDIARIELVVRESNTIAIQLYKTLGFKEEGKFERRILSSKGVLETDVPMGWLNPNYVGE